MTAKRKIAIAALTGAVATVAYGILVEPRWLQLRRETIHVRDLHPDLEGFRIGLLSDMHAKPGRTLKVVTEACRRVMAERPHLIAVTGDFITEQKATFEQIVPMLDGLRAPFGVFAVPGNHDHIGGIEEWRAAVDASPALEDLTNRAVTVRIGEARLCIAGVDDFEHGRPSLDALPSPEQRDFTLLLAHNPDQAERSRRAFDHIDLIVSGHTHAGQIRIPGIGPVKQIIGDRQLFEQGLRRRPWTQVYTTRGLGTIHLPIRFLARPEATILELTGAGRPVWQGKTGL